MRFGNRVRRCVALVVVICSAPAVDGVACGAPLDPAGLQIFPVVESVRLEFERFALQLPYFDAQIVATDAEKHQFQVDDPADSRLHFKLLRDVGDVRFPTNSLIGLLSHADPKVRTLAIAALAHRGEPRALPHIAQLVDDTAQTFVGHPALNATWLMLAGTGPPKREQDVGHFARFVIEQYCPVPNFKKYWSQRKGRTFCAGWFQVAIRRAGVNSYPFPEHRRDRLDAVRKQIERLSADDATWTLLALRYEYGGPELISDEDLVKRCRELGRDKLLLALQRKTPSDDPDVRRLGALVATFVLKFPTELLVPEDADTLIACVERERKADRSDGVQRFVSCLWHLAATELQPARAGEFIRAGLKEDNRLWQDVQLVETLWRLRGEQEAGFLADWFFNYRGDEGYYTQVQEECLNKLSNDARPEFRRLIARLALDARLPKLNPPSLVKLAEVAEVWQAERILDDADIARLRELKAFHWLPNDAAKDPAKAKLFHAARDASVARLRAAVEAWPAKWKPAQ